MSYVGGPNGIINTQKYVAINWFYQFLKTPLKTQYYHSKSYTLGDLEPTLGSGFPNISFPVEI